MMASSKRIRRRQLRRPAAWSRRRRRGLTAIEYCFMLSLIMLAVLLAVQHVGTALKDTFQNADTQMQTHMQ